MQSNYPDILNGHEVQELLNVSERGLRELRARRRLPYLKLGHRTIRYHQQDVFDLLEKTRVRSATDGT